MCALEGNSTEQNMYRCSIYTTLVQLCNELAFSENLKLNLAGWRLATNCRRLSFFLIFKKLKLIIISIKPWFVVKIKFMNYVPNAKKRA